MRLTSNLAALQSAIDQTLNAIREGRAQIETIVQNTQDELVRLEREAEMLQQHCLEAIEKVERLEKEDRKARDRVFVVHRDIHRFTEKEMRVAYEQAQSIQGELSQWRERENQYRIRRDDTLRRIKVMRETARQAELLTLKFEHVTGYLGSELEGVSLALQEAQLQSLVGFQILQMQELERASLAERIHDGPMQLLASALMRLQMATSDTETAEDFRRRVNHVITELKSVVFSLRPPLLDDLGIVPTVRRHVENWMRRVGIEAKVNLIGLEATISPTAKVTIFRCVEEALQNIVGHAGATQISVNLVYGESSLQVQIIDDGVGIPSVDFISWLEQGRTGLALCDQRMKLLGGKFEVVPNTPKGTRFLLEIPIVRGG